MSGQGWTRTGIKTGDTVTAVTWGSEEYDQPPRQVTGRLTVRYVEALDYVQYLVEDEGVDPATIEAT